MQVKQIRVSGENHAFLVEVAKEEARSPSAQLGVILNKMRLEREKNKADG